MQPSDSTGRTTGTNRAGSTKTLSTQSSGSSRPSRPPGQDASEDSPGGIVEKAREGISAAAGQAKEQARRAGSQIRHSAMQSADTLRERGRGAIDEQKHRAAEQLSLLGDAIDQSAQSLTSQGDHQLSSYIAGAANGVRQVSQYLERSDLNSLLEDARQCARRRPVIFYGGLFVAGVLLARFLKAGRQQAAVASESAEFESDPRSYDSEFGWDSQTDDREDTSSRPIVSSGDDRTFSGGAS